MLTEQSRNALIPLPDGKRQGRISAFRLGVYIGSMLHEQPNELCVIVVKCGRMQTGVAVAVEDIRSGTAGQKQPDDLHIPFPRNRRVQRGIRRNVRNFGMRHGIHICTIVQQHLHGSFAAEMRRIP